jgi:hypothetical protein
MFQALYIVGLKVPPLYPPRSTVAATAGPAAKSSPKISRIRWKMCFKRRLPGTVP